jgi:hypothetical protein
MKKLEQKVAEAQRFIQRIKNPQVTYQQALETSERCTNEMFKVIWLVEKGTI